MAEAILPVIAGGAGAGTGILGTLLTAGMTAVSAFGQIQAGRQQQSLMSLQANQAELNARMEMNKGREQSLIIRDQLDRDLASQNAIFSARGTLQGEGSALAAVDQSKENATRDLEVARFGSELSAESSRLRAAQYKFEGKVAKRDGYTNAFNTVANSKSFSTLGSFVSNKKSTSNFNKIVSYSHNPSLLGDL
jgi:hypothetical protein